MALHKWKYEDPHDTNPATATYVFPRNPEKCTSPVIDRNITATGTLGGGAATWEGNSSGKQWSFSGQIVNKAHYDALVFWHKRGNRFKVTDHYGRVMTVVPLSFEHVPQTRRTNYWAGEYTVTVLVVAYTAGTVGDIWS